MYLCMFSINMYVCEFACVHVYLCMCVCMYCRSGNFHVIKFSGKNIFVVQDTHKNFLTVLNCFYSSGQ